MTNVFFVRHAEADTRVHDDLTRPLTEKGLADRRFVTRFLAARGVSVVVCSPYKRAVDTVAEFAAQQKLGIIGMDCFKERRIADAWIDDFDAYAQRQWADFSYKLAGGESLGEVQARNVAGLRRLLAAYPGQAIAVGTHGTALATVIHHFDASFTYHRFAQMVHLMPWIVHLQFDGDACLQMDFIDPCDGCACKPAGV